MSEITIVPKEKNIKGRPKLRQLFVLDPFQIYCILNRSLIIEKNPTKKNCEVTSILASLWRGLSSREKQRYKYLAAKLQHNKKVIHSKKELVCKEDQGEETELQLDFGDFALLPSDNDSEENLQTLLEMYGIVAAND